MQSVAKRPKKRVGGSGRLSDDQLHGNGDIRHHAGLQILDQVMCQQFSCEGYVLPDRRQGRVAVLGNREIIVADHGNILRDTASLFADRVHGGDRHEVTVDEHRVDFGSLFEQSLHRLGAGRVREIAMLD